VSFEERLEELRSRVEGTQAVCIVADDGILVESAGGEDVDLEAIAAEVVTQVRNLGDAQRGLGVGPVREMAFRTERYTILLGSLPEGHYLVMVLSADVPQGRARFEVRRAPLVLEDEWL
jgi:predicted regulator of Ras-like GTPase activity (Roadblock/LC7/MglB family)